MANWELGIANWELGITNCELGITNCELVIIKIIKNYPLPITH